MTPSPTPDLTPAQVAPDLEAHEAAVVSWFAAMGQAQMPSSVCDEFRAQIWNRGAEARLSLLGRLRAAPRQFLGPLLSRPLLSPLRVSAPRAWAAAAVLALAVGTGWWLLPSDTTGPTEPSRLSLAIEDPSLSLFHGLETFDRVGMEPGDLIADWTR